MFHLCIFLLDQTNGWTSLNKLQGKNIFTKSALEHVVPEQMFTDPNDPSNAQEAISAVKALSKAQAAGQRIYHITSANQATALPNINHDSLTMGEIQAALAVGKEVITHTDAVSVPGWTGAGYIIFDPVVGDGAYKISGGVNGGILAGLLVLGVLGFLTSLFFFAMGTLLAVALGAVLLATSILLLMSVGDQGYYSQVFVGLSLAAAIFALVVLPPLVLTAALIEIALYAVAFILVPYH